MRYIIQFKCTRNGPWHSTAGDWDDKRKRSLGYFEQPSDSIAIEKFVPKPEPDDGYKISGRRPSHFADRLVNIDTKKVLQVNLDNGRIIKPLPTTLVQPSA